MYIFGALGTFSQARKSTGEVIARSLVCNAGSAATLSLNAGIDLDNISISFLYLIVLMILRRSGFCVGDSLPSGTGRGYSNANGDIIPQLS